MCGPELPGGSERLKSLNICLFVIPGKSQFLRYTRHPDVYVYTNVLQLFTFPLLVNKNY